MEKAGRDFAAIPKTAVRVLPSPAAFFQEMPKAGGFTEPLVFMVAMGVVGGLIQSIVSILGLSVAAGMMTGLASVVVAPILIAIFGFIGAAILFVIWKLLGSQQSYETANRCNAYLGSSIAHCCRLRSDFVTPTGEFAQINGRRAQKMHVKVQIDAEEDKAMLGTSSSWYGQDWKELIEANRLTMELFARALFSSGGGPSRSEPEKDKPRRDRQRPAKRGSDTPMLIERVTDGPGAASLEEPETEEEIAAADDDKSVPRVPNCPPDSQLE